MNKESVLYVVIDKSDPCELPLFSGTLSEVCKFTGKSKNAILSAISHSKERGQKCQYIKIGNEEEL